MTLSDPYKYQPWDSCKRGYYFQSIEFRVLRFELDVTVHMNAFSIFLLLIAISFLVPSSAFIYVLCLYFIDVSASSFIYIFCFC